MEIHLNSAVEAKLTRLAAAQGSDAEALAREAIERFVDHGEWFAQQVGEGIAAAERGEFVEHDEVGKLIDSRFPG